MVVLQLVCSAVCIKLVGDSCCFISFLNLLLSHTFTHTLFETHHAMTTPKLYSRCEGLAKKRTNVDKALTMSRFCNKEGIVWARVPGYRHWPARVISDEERLAEPSYSIADRHRNKRHDTLVLFYGTREIAWLTKKSAICPWKKGLKRNFLQTRTKNKDFENSLEEVESVYMSAVESNSSDKI